MRINENDLGAIVKAARIKNSMTQDALGEAIGVGLRHVMGIENEGSKPSYEVLYKLVRELHIPSDDIFYPEKLEKDDQLAELIRILYCCNEHSLKIIHATAQAALEVQEK